MGQPVVVIGAGLAGLTAAKVLCEAGVEAIVLEGSDGVGGRARTDSVDGHLLDRGFQVLLTGYPEARKQLDYEQLDLQAFDAGSIIRVGDRFARISDPWRQPERLLETAFAPVGTLRDKMRIGRLRKESQRGSVEDQFRRPDQTTDQELRDLGFTTGFVDQFLRPFFGGIFLDRDLVTSCRMMYFVFRMFGQHGTALPATGMGAIAQQLADSLPEGAVRLGSRVAAIDDGHIQLDGGDLIACRHLVVATDQDSAEKLVPELKRQREPRRVRCVYFSAEKTPVNDKMLVLNGTGRGVVNNLCVPSQIAPQYAPSGRSLISVSVLDSKVDNDDLHRAVSEEVTEWFGREVADWKHLRTYDIAAALPDQSTPAFDQINQPTLLRDNVSVCGDYRSNGSINGAMESGRLAAEAILHES